MTENPEAVRAAWIAASEALKRGDFAEAAPDA